MARVVYFVLSHTNVPQVVRLIRRIRAEVPASSVLVHHDATEGPFDLDAFARDPGVRILSTSIHAQWAQFSLVEIVLRGIEDLAEQGSDYAWLVLVSGQDYPIRPLVQFERALERSGDGLIYYDPEPGQLLDRYAFSWRRLPPALQLGVMHRVIGLLTRLNPHQGAVRFISGRVGCQIGTKLRRSPLPPARRFYKGTQWWALSRRAIEYIRSYLAVNPGYVRHYRNHTIIPDESFFHTILFNADGNGYSFVNDDQRFTRWGPPGSSSPEILRLTDLEAIRASHAFFARKFDTRVDAAILDALDASEGRPTPEEVRP